MKKIFTAALFALLLIAPISCNPLDLFETPEEEEGEFIIIGKWGMVSGVIADADGTAKRYSELGNGYYYEYLEFKVDGTLIRTSMPDENVSYGVYTYNEATKELSYKFDGNKYYFPGIVSVISAKEMNLTTDYGPTIGRITQYFKKLK